MSHCNNGQVQFAQHMFAQQVAKYFMTVNYSRTRKVVPNFSHLMDNSSTLETCSSVKSLSRISTLIVDCFASKEL